MSGRSAFRFDGWELRLVERQLLVHERPVALGSRAFDLLAALVERQGRVVTHAELLAAAWPGLVVEANNVSVQIAALRKVLGPRSILNVAGRGYKLGVRPLDLSAGLALAGAAAGPLAPGDELLGRADDLVALEALAAGAPLVTIAGSGGIGKTTLARAFVAGLGVAPADGVHWIDAAPLQDGAQLGAAIAGPLGIPLGLAAGAEPGEALAAALAQRRALVVLDNLEHLQAPAARLLGAALAAAPGMRWLATSQQPLRVAGERVFRLGPLAVPPPGTPAAEARGWAAPALLCRRAGSGRSRFELDEGNVAAAIELCRQLDGLPLAIEMAAALVAGVGLASVHEQLGQRLGSLASPRRAGAARHHSLRATLAWTHGLLSAPEQRLFRRLAPFVGGFTAAQAQRIGRDPDDTPDALDEWQALAALGALVDKSLVQRDADGGERFRLFESARDDARRRLADAGEEPLVQRRHAHVMAELADALCADFETWRDADWLARYAPERHNLRAALAWACRADEPDLLARLVAGLGRVDGFLRAPAEILRLPLPMDLLDQALPSFRGPALLELAAAQMSDGHLERGSELVACALEDFRAAGDEAGAYRALALQARLFESRPGLQAQAREAWAGLRAFDSSRLPARTVLEAAIATGLQYGGERTPERLRDLEAAAARCGFEALATVCRVHLLDEWLVAGRHAEVVEGATRWLAQGVPHARVRATVLHNQALALALLGRHAEAQGTAMQALRLLPQLSPVVLVPLALAAVQQGRFREGAMLAGWIAQVLEARQQSLDPAEAIAHEQALARLRQAMGPQRLAELMRMGAAMPAPGLLATAMPLAPAAGPQNAYQGPSAASAWPQIDV